MEEEDRYTRITLRIPKALHARLDSEAERTSKSLNAEIIARLQASFERVRAPVTEMEVAAYKSHAMALETQGMAMQHQLVDLMSQLTHIGDSNSEVAKILRHQIALVQAKILEIDQMTIELHAKAKALTAAR